MTFEMMNCDFTLMFYIKPLGSNRSRLPCYESSLFGQFTVTTALLCYTPTSQSAYMYLHE